VLPPRGGHRVRDRRETAVPSDTGLELLQNAAATAAALVAINLIFGPVPGAPFNPGGVLGRCRLRRAVLAGRDSLPARPGHPGVIGAVAANLMHSLAAVSVSTKQPVSGAHGLSEVIATPGPILVIFALPTSRPQRWSAYIGAAC
jgi:hypothetical protein